MERLNQLDSPLDAMRRLNREHDQLPFLLQNAQAFLEQGVLEQAVVEVYTWLLFPCAEQGVQAWEKLFQLSDQESLRATPQRSFCPLKRERFAMYRASSLNDLKKDLSWTLSMNQAQHDMEQQWGGAQEPRVYRIIAGRDDIAFFTNARGKLEGVLNPGSALFSHLPEGAEEVTGLDEKEI